MTANLPYSLYFLTYLVLTILVARFTHRRYGLGWTDSAIAANGVMSSLVLLSLLIAFTFGADLPYRLSPPAFVSVAVVFFNNYRGNVSHLAKQKPSPEASSARERGE